MENKASLALVYVRNGQTHIFPIKDIDHAIRLADAIADSDLLNDEIGYNMLDVCEYFGGDIGECWESEDEESFEEYWRKVRMHEAAEEDQSDKYKEGELVIYKNGDSYEIGKIKRLTPDGAFIWYSNGDTAAKTPYEAMHKIVNVYAMRNFLTTQ